MNEKQIADRIKYAGEKVESMKRRANFNDYHERRMYMITMNIEGRIPLFGDVVGDCDIPWGEHDCPRIELSELGKRVANNWERIHDFHQEIEIEFLQMMPDHFHGILFVQEHMEKHLGDALWGFKVGCNNDYKELGLASGMQLGMPTLSMPTLGMPTKYVGLQDQAGLQDPPIQQPLKPTKRSKKGMLFEIGYNDKILYEKGQLERWINYLRDNPRRLLMKRQHPDLFRVVHELKIGERTFAAIGNRFLLDMPIRMQVRCHNNETPKNLKLIEKQKEYFLERATDGGVIVSPCISNGEKKIARAALDAMLPLIVILENGFPPMYKPSGKYFDACAEGRLLMLAPWPYHQEKRKITRWQCLELNGMAGSMSTEPWTLEHEARIENMY